MQIGIDLGGSHIGVGIVKEDGKIAIKKEKDINIENLTTEQIKLQIRDNIIYLINETLRQVGAPICLIEKIGIAVPGCIKNGVIKVCHNLKIKDFDLAKLLKEYYEVEIYMQNDAKCAALAEKKYGALRNSNDAVFMCLGTGIGGATFINGKILKPIKNAGSEFGHMIIEKNGIECNCGNKGCFETYVSMKAFKNQIVKLLDLDNNISSEEILNILKNKKEDKQINEYIDKYVDYLILGISNICNILEPEIICIGGSFVYYEDILYKRLLEKLQLHKYHFEVPEVVLAKLGNDAGIIGASLI